MRVGNAVGRGDQPGVRHAGWIAVGLIFLLMLIAGLSIRLFRGDIAVIYTGDVAVIDAALPALAVVSLLVVFDGVQGVLMGALRGTGDVVLPTVTYAIAFWACSLPLCYYFGYRQATGAAGIAWGLTAGLVVACVMLGLRFAVVARRHLYAV